MPGRKPPPDGPPPAGPWEVRLPFPRPPGARHEQSAWRLEVARLARRAGIPRDVAVLVEIKWWPRTGGPGDLSDAARAVLEGLNRAGVRTDPLHVTCRVEPPTGEPGRITFTVTALT